MWERVLTPTTPVVAEAREVAGRINEDIALGRIIGTSPGIAELKRQILVAAKSPVTVLITGETGTGKELVAQAIHYLSPRASKPFIPVNCGAIPAALFENELFGHHAGAFTDARSREIGLLAEAENGTLFLDEIDSLPLQVQVKLLRLLEDRSYRPLGSPRAIGANIRLVGATNANLQAKVAEGAFRSDLYYRLHLIPLRLPSLRERGEDILRLAEHFLGRYGKDRRWRLSPDACRALRNHTWPGNVRELENLIQRIVIMNEPKLIDVADLQLPAVESSGVHDSDSFRAAREAAIQRFERRYLERILEVHGGNISSAARTAQQDRSSFRRLLKKYCLHDPGLNVLTPDRCGR